MKKIIARLMYRIFRDEIEYALLEDYLRDVPDFVKEQSLYVISEHKHKFEKLVSFLALSLHKRIAQDPNNSLKYKGMFIQLKIMDKMISTAVEKKKEEVIDKKQSKVKTTYESAIKSAEEFLEKIKK